MLSYPAKMNDQRYRQQQQSGNIGHHLAAVHDKHRREGHQQRSDRGGVDRVSNVVSEFPAGDNRQHTLRDDCVFEQQIGALWRKIEDRVRDNIETVIVKNEQASSQRHRRRIAAQRVDCVFQRIPIPYEWIDEKQDEDQSYRRRRQPPAPCGKQQFTISHLTFFICHWVLLRFALLIPAETATRELDKDCRCAGHQERVLLLRTRPCLSPGQETTGWELRFHFLPGSPATLCLSLAGIRQSPPDLWERHQKKNDRSGRPGCRK